MNQTNSREVRSWESETKVSAPSASHGDVQKSGRALEFQRACNEDFMVILSGSLRPGDNRDFWVTDKRRTLGRGENREDRREGGTKGKKVGR